MIHDRWTAGWLAASILLLGACGGAPPVPPAGLEIKFLVGSALSEFCQQSAAQFNQQRPKLANGKEFRLTCAAQGSGDVVTEVLARAQQVKAGTLPPESPDLPTLLSVDGEIYHSQLIDRMNQLLPGQTPIPAITEAPLLASSPLVFMAQTDVAAGLRQVERPYKTLATATTHRDVSPQSPPLKVHYAQTAPPRSNSGLQTLIAQFAEISGKRPEQLTVADVQQYQAQVQQLQSKVTRYGTSTHALATAMVKNGPFWATVGSVYEASVIAANAARPAGQPRYEAIYPKSTFSSNMRAILPQVPWVSADERAAAEQVITYLRSPAAQAIAAQLGLRPGVPGVPLGDKFTAEFGVDPQARYDSYRPPQPEVVAAMLKSWQDVSKKPSLVAIIVDTSGSMSGTKLPSVQQTLQTYINQLGPKDEIALIDFDSDIRAPIRVDGTPAGRDRGLQFISSLEVGGGTKLYDATLYARNWLQQNLRPNAINAVLVLTDGEDSGSQIRLEALNSELQRSGFGSDQRIAVFTVGYGNEGEFNPQALQEIADRNGGYYSKGNPETIAQVLSNLQTEF